jgi:cysteine desulfurase
VGFGAAAAISLEALPKESGTLRGLRDRLLAGLRDRLSEVCVNGSAEHGLPNTLNASFAGVESEALLLALPEIALSGGAACASGHGSGSHVLAAMGLPEERIHGAVRFSLGRFSTAEQVDYVVDRVARAVSELRKGSPAWRLRRS